MFIYFVLEFRIFVMMGNTNDVCYFVLEMFVMMVWVPWLLARHPYSKGLNRSKPIGQTQVPLPTCQAQVSSHEHEPEPEPRLESRLVDYLIIAKACKIYCLDTSSHSRLPSLRRWPTNKFPADPSQLENTYSHESRT